VLYHSEAESRLHARLAGLRTPEAETESLIARLLEGASLGLYRGATRLARERAALLERAREHARRARLAGWAFAALTALFLGYQIARARPAPVVHHLLGASALCLAVGLAAPVLTVIAHERLPLLGEVVLQHETRSVLSTVSGLARAGEPFLAALLGLFSVVVPVLKLVLAGLALTPLPARHRRLAERVLGALGRWSLTDVLVVAILLAFLASESARLTEARLGLGLYFFAAYGLLSMLAGQLMVRHREALLGGGENEEEER